MIRTYNNGRKYETTAKSIVSEDYPELVTLVTVTEDDKDFTAYRTDCTPEEVYAKLRWLYRCEDYEEIEDLPHAPRHKSKKMKPSYLISVDTYGDNWSKREKDKETAINEAKRLAQLPGNFWVNVYEENDGEISRVVGTFH